jgi:hypothetical protein
MKSMKQVTNVVMMIRPSRFRCNEQTAVNNYFQTPDSAGAVDDTTVTASAQTEFDAFTSKLIDNGIRVLTVQDDDKFDTPDSVFPNNWISFHQRPHSAACDDKTIDINIYPMYAVNRRHEKNLLNSISSALKSEFDLTVKVSNDFSSFEDSDKFLEGTGSLVLDRTHAIAYCAISPRAHPDLLDKFCTEMRYTPVPFTAYQTVKDERVPIYHTNVMMCVGDTFAIICLDCIDDNAERNAVENSLTSTGKEVIAITEEQIYHFAGNMLQLQSSEKNFVLVMSSEAFSSLTPDQKHRIEAHCPILHAPLPVIEGNGGGSARCMMAEVFF